MELIQFAQRNYSILLRALSEHVQMVLIALILSVALAGMLTILAMFFKPIGKFLIYLSSIIYSIPSIALFALMIPLPGLGLGRATAITVLVLYNQFILLRNFITGLNGVDHAIIEAAAGMGMKPTQIILKVRVPLSIKSIFVGIRLALISTIAIAIIASFIGAGGIGLLVTIGLETNNNNRIIWGVILSVGLGIVANAILVFIEKRIKR
ncbi:MAG: ABC transporter permease subunit [Defluviitaleaceae bacterium]|nr:ABC transporter permease subunit [Defluviitaleaceae bacterium]